MTTSELPALPEPAGFRVRYRSEPGMVGHYPWSYADQGRRRREWPNHEVEDLYTADQVRALLAREAVEVPQVRYMPIMKTPLAIPFALLNEEWAQRNHGQSLARLAERGGLGPCEALAIVKRERWGQYRHLTQAEVLTALLAAAPLS
jgi:hypothetical protein